MRTRQIAASCNSPELMSARRREGESGRVAPARLFALEASPELLEGLLPDRRARRIPRMYCPVALTNRDRRPSGRVSGVRADLAERQVPRGDVA